MCTTVDLTVEPDTRSMPVTYAWSVISSESEGGASSTTGRESNVKEERSRPREEPRRRQEQGQDDSTKRRPSSDFQDDHAETKGIGNWALMYPNTFYIVTAQGHGTAGPVAILYYSTCHFENRWTSDQASRQEFHGPPCSSEKGRPVMSKWNI